MRVKEYCGLCGDKREQYGMDFDLRCNNAECRAYGHGLWLDGWTSYNKLLVKNR